MTEGWVIMNANMDQYRAWQDGGTVWVKDLADATFYARRVDAEAVHLDDDAAWRVVLRPLPDGGEAVHTGQLRDDQSSSPPPSVDHIAEAGKMVSPPSGEVREAVARIIYFVYGDGLSVASAMSPTNDAHWLHWKGQAACSDTWRAADAILALIPARDEAALPESLSAAVEKLASRHALPWVVDWRPTGDPPEAFAGSEQGGVGRSDDYEPCGYDDADGHQIDTLSVEFAMLVEAIVKIAMRAPPPPPVAASIAVHFDRTTGNLKHPDDPASRAPTDTGEGA